MSKPRKRYDLNPFVVVPMTNSHQMVDLKENIESEIQSAHDEYLRLESHIKLYITEMEKCI